MATGPFVTHLECSQTGERHAAGVLHNLSRASRPLLVRYDFDGARGSMTREALDRRPADMWRWREILPFPEGTEIVSLGESETPLVPLPGIGGGANLQVKDEGRLPTGSFKARGIAVAVTMARTFGVERVAMPTNGNAGAALAAYGARAGMEVTLFCPSDTPEVNLGEMAGHGATVHRIDGMIDQCGALVADGAAEGRWFDMSTLKEPYRLEGKKVMGLELALQLGWELPELIFYPTGGGTGLIGMWKAFAEMEALGLIGVKRPRMVAVQAEGCAPIVRAWENGADRAERWEGARTAAAGIRVPRTIGDALILGALRESGGFAISASEDEIARARADAALQEGLLLCPEGAATLAAWRKSLAEGRIRATDRAVLFNCASGLKYELPAIP